MDIARRHGAIVLTDTRSLGSARMKGIAECDTEWVAFVDDDIFLPEGFVEEVMDKADWSVGAVQGAVRSVHQPHRDLLTEEYESRFSGGDTFDLRPGDRGLTSATLVRRSLIEDMDLANMDTWEDCRSPRGCSNPAIAGSCPARSWTTSIRARTWPARAAGTPPGSSTSVGPGACRYPRR